LIEITGNGGQNVKDTRRRWLAVAAVMFGVGWGANQFASLLIAYHQKRGLTISVNEALFGIYALGLVPALILGGPASDRWGRRRGRQQWPGIDRNLASRTSANCTEEVNISQTMTVSAN